MNSVSKSLALGCALGIAGCAQSGFNAGPGALPPSGLSTLQNPGRAGSPLGRSRQRTGSDAPAIYVFQGQPDAQVPLVGLVNVGTTLYGTTTYGGTNDLGALYSVTTSGVETVMHSFAGGTGDGEYPYAPLTNVNGTLYGTASNAGTEHGVIFSITPGGSYHILYNFGVTTGDCFNPETAMIYVKSKKALYGTTYGGGATGEGCIFKLSLAGKKPTESIVYSFTGAASSSTQASAPVYYKNALYVTTPGGGANGFGAVLKVTLKGKESVVYSFKDEPDGANPEAALTVVGTALYGTTIDGGMGACGGYAGCGIVFKVTTAGKETILHRFTDVVSKVDGSDPQSPLTAIGNTLYGVTANCTGNGCGAGTIFAVTTSENNGGDSIVWDFGDVASDPPGLPLAPFGSLVSLNGEFYGTTADSAKTGYGTVYAVPQ